MTIHRIMPDDRSRPDGTKGRALELFRKHPDVQMTLANVCENLGMSKLQRPEISSALAKLVQEGKVVKIADQPTQSARGRKLVNFYQLAEVPQ